jgi:hypothetical protein
VEGDRRILGVFVKHIPLAQVALATAGRSAFVNRGKLDHPRAALAIASDALGWLTPRPIGNRDRPASLNTVRLAIFERPQQLRDRSVRLRPFGAARARLLSNWYRLAHPITKSGA